MSADLVLSETLARSRAAMRRYLRNTRSASTLKAYATDCRYFIAWCEENDLSPLPAEPDTVALYLSDLAGQRSVSCVERRLSAIGAMHEMADCPSPTRDDRVRRVLRGIRRTKGLAQRRKAAAVTDMIVAMAVARPDTLIGKRDKALLLFGFASALRRAELCGLTTGDVEFTPDGVAVTLARSKTDQFGRGQVVGVLYGRNPTTCPVSALSEWLQAANIQDGLLFRSVDRHGNVGSSFSGRAVATVAGVAPHNVMRQTRHRQLHSLDRYVRMAGLFRDSPVAQLGL